MGEAGVCADGEALYAVFRNGASTKAIPLKAKFIAEADEEVRQLIAEGHGTFQSLDARSGLSESR